MDEQIPERGQTYLSNIGLKVMWEKQRTSTLLSPPQSEEAEFNLLCQLKALAGQAPPARASFFGEFMTSDDRLLLIQRRLDEIERKLDQMLEELRSPTAIGYSARRGNRPRKELIPLAAGLLWWPLPPD